MINRWQVYELNDKYPVYDDNDNVIGYTSCGDVAVIISANQGEDYYELIVTTGMFARYTKLALNKADILKGRLIKFKYE